MKKTVLKAVYLVLAVAFIAGCKTPEPKLQFPPNNDRNSALTDGCGHLDKMVNIDTITPSFVTDEYAPVYVEGSEVDYMFYTSSRRIYGRDSMFTNRPAELMYSTRPVGLRNAPPNYGWSYGKNALFFNPQYDRSTKGSVAFGKNLILIAGESDMSSFGASSSNPQGQMMDIWIVERTAENKFNFIKSFKEINTEYFESQPCFSPDGKTIFFVSNRPMPGRPGSRDMNIWYVQKSGDGWSQAKPLDNTINTEADEIAPSYAKSGCFYFSRNGGGNFDVFVCKAGKPCCSTAKEISYKLPTNPWNMNDFAAEYYPSRKSLQFNTQSDEIFASESNDGKNIFWSSNFNTSYGKLDLFACVIPEPPKPRIDLAVEIWETMTEKKGVKGQPVLNNRLQLTVRDLRGTSIGTVTSGAAPALQLLPNQEYTVTFDGEIRTCGFCNKPEMQTFRTCECDSTIRLFDTIECQVTTAFDTLKSTNFITGYWYPHTPSNYAQFRKRAESGFFAEAPYVDAKYNAGAVDLQPLFDKIKGYINQFSDCFNDKNGFALRISLIGLTDQRGLRPGKFVEDQYVPESMKTGSPLRMDNNQRGNVPLSRLRAHYTKITIIDELSKDPQIGQKFKEMLNNGRILFDTEGYGIDPNSTPGDCPNSRRVDVTIDIGPKNLIEKNQRIIPGHVAWKEFSFEKKTNKPKSLTAPLFVGRDKYVEPKEECNCYEAEYFFRDKAKAELVYRVIMEYGEEELYLEETEDANGNDLWRLHSGCFEERANANRYSVYLREIVHKAANALLQVWPSLGAQCDDYYISVGTFKREQDVNKYLVLLDSLREEGKVACKYNIIEVEDEEIEATVYRLVSESALSRQHFEAELKKVVKSLNARRLPHYSRIIHRVQQVQEEK